MDYKLLVFINTTITIKNCLLPTRLFVLALIEKFKRLNSRVIQQCGA